ncbi:MAG: hypothetical protein JXA44_13280 [Methanospirillaceae archaeon]|nr:hypothetical protein [Methanospirillaceae archaeon]
MNKWVIILLCFCLACLGGLAIAEESATGLDGGDGIPTDQEWLKEQAKEAVKGILEEDPDYSFYTVISLGDYSVFKRAIAENEIIIRPGEENEYFDGKIYLAEVPVSHTTNAGSLYQELLHSLADNPIGEQTDSSSIVGFSPVNAENIPNLLEFLPGYINALRQFERMVRQESPSETYSRQQIEKQWEDVKDGWQVIITSDTDSSDSGNLPESDIPASMKRLEELCGIVINLDEIQRYYESGKAGQEFSEFFLALNQGGSPLSEETTLLSSPDTASQVSIGIISPQVPETTRTVAIIQNEPEGQPSLPGGQETGQEAASQPPVISSAPIIPSSESVLADDTSSKPSAGSDPAMADAFYELVLDSEEKIKIAHAAIKAASGEKDYDAIGLAQKNIRDQLFFNAYQIKKIELPPELVVMADNYQQSLQFMAEMFDAAYLHNLGKSDYKTIQPRMKEAEEKSGDYYAQFMQELKKQNREVYNQVKAIGE